MPALVASILRHSSVASTPRYAAVLRLVLSSAWPDKPWDALDTSYLTPETVARYFTARELAANLIPDQRRSASMRRSANSIFRQASALFSPATLARLRFAGLALPGLESFLGAGKKFRLRTPSLNHTLPDQSLIRRTLISWARLPDRNVFLAAGHALSCGLRAGEMSQARWSWHTQRDGVPILRASSVAVKNQTGHLEVVPLDPFWTIMQRRLTREKWRGDATSQDYILTGHDTERRDEVFRRVSGWLRMVGWTTQKTNHALRDLSASLITMKYGLDHAKYWCRHASIRTTERYYNRMVDPLAVLSRRQKLAWLRFVEKEMLTAHTTMTYNTPHEPTHP